MTPDSLVLENVINYQGVEDEREALKWLRNESLIGHYQVQIQLHGRWPSSQSEFLPDQVWVDDVASFRAIEG